MIYVKVSINIMTKQKNKIISKYPLRRRKTFQKHPKHYAKVYAPYLPAIIGFVFALVLLLPRTHSASVLSEATNTSPSGLLSQTNQKRQSNGDKSLSLNQALATAAQTKANDMAKNNYWSHVTPDGKQPWYFINQAGYHYSEAAENLAYGFLSSEDTINGWMNSPSHREAMLNKDYTQVGFGIANAPNYQGHGPETIVVAMYAKPSSPVVANVNSSFTNTPASTITKGQILTNGDMPWINLLAGIAIGAIFMYLAAKHSLKLRKKIRDGERYMLTHPAFDLTLVSLLVVLAALSKTAGFIN